MLDTYKIGDFLKAVGKVQSNGSCTSTLASPRNMLEMQMLNLTWDLFHLRSTEQNFLGPETVTNHLANSDVL